jgi:NTE family protein
MDPEQGTGGYRPRIGLVLGAGGVLGAAWMTGVLPALQKRLPCAINEVDLIVGTSAGSVVAAAVRCGLGVDEMVAYNRGAAVGVLADVGLAPVEEGPLPPLPRLRLGSPRLMGASLLTPHRVHPLVGASAWLPHGRGRHVALRSMVHTLHTHAHRHAAVQESVPQEPMPQESVPHWVNGQTWIVAVDYDSGRRVIFGRDGAPRVRLADAVVASCSIPGWYEPVVIDGRRYVDGGVRSATSLGAVARAGVDEVYVLAPMASLKSDRPRNPLERAERRLRRLFTRALLRDVNSLRSLGVRVTVVTPGPEDLAVMGANLMDPRRRITVLETSLRTSAAALASPEHGDYLTGGGSPAAGGYPEDDESKVA